MENVKEQTEQEETKDVNDAGFWDSFSEFFADMLSAMAAHES